MEILISESAIARRVTELAEEISRDYAAKKPHFIGVLNGSFIFLSDLVRKISIPCTLDFISVSSYNSSMVSSGKVEILGKLRTEITGKDVILTEDIADTRNTLSALRRLISGMNPASLKICALLDKPERRVATDAELDYTGFVIPDKFVVGYGLDFAEDWRQLPYIGVMDAEHS